MIKREKDRGYSMEALYRYLGVTRQGLHKSQKAKKTWKQKEQEALAEVEKIRRNHPRMGARSMHYSIGLKCMGVNRFEKLVAENGLSIKKKKRRIVTTDSHGSKRYPNLINGLVLNGINQVIVADITYYIPDNQVFYIFTLKDVYSQYTLSLRASDNMKAFNALLTLDDFVSIRGNSTFPGLIFHSDNGGQYDAIAFTDRLASLQIEISRAKNSMENGSAESLNNIVKNQYLVDKVITDVGELQKTLDEIKWRINNEKSIKSLGYRTVIEFEKYILSLPAEKRPKKQLHDFDNEEKR